MAYSPFRLCLLALFAFLPACSVRSQALPTAEKSTDVSVFLNSSIIKTGYAGSMQPGISGGADYTAFLPRLALAASLEARASYTPVFRYVGQRVVSAGLRLESTRSGRIRPSGHFLAGAGKVFYVFPPNASDRAVVFTFGAGVDVDLRRRFSVRLEAEGSRWRPDPAVIVYPVLLNMGLVYHLPLGRGFAR